jgi:hypothetical protein
MKYLQRSSEYFNQSLLEAHEIDWNVVRQKLSEITLPKIGQLSPQMELAVSKHEDFLLENFSSMDEINESESILRRYGYYPVFLTLEGAYHETLSAISSINEDIWSGAFGMVKNFLMAVTNDGDPRGILQFMLDIIGLLPGHLLGVPINVAANLINAMIYYYHDEYLLAIISGIMAIPATGQIIGAAIKLAMKPFSGILKLLGKAIGLGEKTAIKTAALELKAAKGSSGFIAKFAPALKDFGRVLATVGAKFFRGMAAGINWIIERVFGKGKKLIPTNGMKFLDELVVKSGTIGRSAEEAAEILLKSETAVAATAVDLSTATAKAVSQDAEIIAKNMGKTSAEAAEIATKEAERIAKQFQDIPGFSKEIQSEVMQSAGYQKLLSKNASDAAKNAFLKKEVTKNLVDKVIKEAAGSKSLVEVLKNPEIISTLAKTRGGLKITEKAVVDAFRTGNLKVIREITDVVTANPKLMGAVSPTAAKALSVFKTTPEVFTNGSKVFNSAVKATNSFPKISLPGFKNILSFHGKVSARRYLLFVLKMYLKQSECAQQLLKGPASTALGKTMSAAADLAMENIPSGVKAFESVKRILSKNNSLTEEYSSGSSAVNYKQTDAFSESDLAALSQDNPEVYSALKNQQADVDETVTDFAKKFLPNNLCSLDASVAQAAAGATLAQTAPLISQTGLYKGVGGGDVTNIFDEEAAAGLTNVLKSQLQAVGEDPNIDPQHPISEADPFTKAYLSDAYDFDEELYLPNTTGESRLEKTVDRMIEKGEINQSDRDKVIDATVEHWEKGTVPDGILKFEESADDEAYESKTLSNVSRLKVKPLSL